MTIPEMQIMQKKILEKIINLCNNKEVAKYKITMSWLNQQIVDWVDSGDNEEFYQYLYNRLDNYGLINQELSNVMFLDDMAIDVKSIRPFLKKTKFGYYLQ